MLNQHRGSSPELCVQSPCVRNGRAWVLRRGPLWEGKAGTIWQFSVCLEKQAFRGRVLLDTSRESTKMWQILGVWVSQILVNKASGDSVLQVLGNKARKNCHIVPVLAMYRGPLLHPNRCPMYVSVSLPFPMRFLQGKRSEEAQHGGSHRGGGQSFPRTHDRRTHGSWGIRNTGALSLTYQL